MPVEWAADLSVGITEIDDQHKELLRRSNDILDALREKGKDAAERIVAFLQNYLASHFETEEKYMMRYGYPQYISHKAQHTLYLMELSGIKHGFLSGNLDSPTQVQEKIIDPLIGHIKQDDKALGSFINNAKQKKAA